MGARGPQPMPAAVRLATGNAGRRSLDLSDGMNPEVKLPDAPPYVKSNKYALKEWKRAGTELFDLGCIAAIDRAEFANYCMAVGRLSQLELAFAAHQKHAMVQARQQGVDPVVAVTAPFFQTTPTGFKRDSALIRQINDHMDIVHRFAQAFGMNPSARTRIVPSTNQLPLPGIEAPAPANSDENTKLSLASFL